MKRYLIAFISFTTLILSSASAEENTLFHPIEHASLVITNAELTILVDPVGELKNYQKFSPPDIILITHTHHDHFNKDLVNQLKQEKTIIIGPQAVIDELGNGEILNNGEQIEVESTKIEAVPMYNTSPERLNFHPKGAGNGYVITLNKQRIYIAGDTEDIPEMRALKDIEYAFICMNLPYTMTVEQAASAVLEMQPKTVIPYHYREKDGFSDLNKFQTLLSKNPDIKINLLNWYPKDKPTNE